MAASLVGQLVALPVELKAVQMVDALGDLEAAMLDGLMVDC